MKNPQGTTDTTNIKSEHLETAQQNATGRTMIRSVVAVAAVEKDPTNALTRVLDVTTGKRTITLRVNFCVFIGTDQAAILQIALLKETITISAVTIGALIEILETGNRVGMDVTKVVAAKEVVETQTHSTAWLHTPISRKRTQIAQAKRKMSREKYSGMASSGYLVNDKKLTSILCRRT